MRTIRENNSSFSSVAYQGIVLFGGLKWDFDFSFKGVIMADIYVIKFPRCENSFGREKH